MKRRRKISGFGDAGSVAMGILPVVGGYLLGNIIEKQFLAGSSYGTIAKLGGGVLLASMTKGTIAQLGIGIAINGAAELGEAMLSKTGLGLLPPGAPARYLAGFADGGNTFDGQQYPFKAWP